MMKKRKTVLPASRIFSAVRLFLFKRARGRKTLLELVDPPAGIHELLLARVERVAFRADFDMHRPTVCRTRLNFVAAGAFDRNVFIFGMYSLLHA
jgi:hypothetical protein